MLTIPVVRYFTWKLEIVSNILWMIVGTFLQELCWWLSLYWGSRLSSLSWSCNFRVKTSGSLNGNCLQSCLIYISIAKTSNITNNQPNYTRITEITSQLSKFVWENKHANREVGLDKVYPTLLDKANALDWLKIVHIMYNI